MQLNAPPNPNLKLSSTPEKLIVLLGPAGGAAPQLTDETEELRVLSIERSAGAGRLDHCVLDYDLAKAQKRLVDLQTPVGFSRKLQVVQFGPDQGETWWGSLFYGELGIQSADLGSSEHAAVIARVERWHFGNPVTGIDCMLPDGTTVMHFNLPLVFNPVIDDLLTGNMSDATHPTVGIVSGGSAVGYSLWIDPESTRTTTAQTYQNQTSGLWSLADAVGSLCFSLNPSETFIKNPALIDLVNVIPSYVPNPENVHIPVGDYLPEALDKLLNPLGYSWYLKPQRLTDPGTGLVTPSNQIVIFPRGIGPTVQVRYQLPGEPLDVAQTNAQEVGLEWNIADLANQVEVYGSLQERQITAELYRAWPESDDSLLAGQLKKEGSLYPTKPDVWRKWVLNEAGDYCGLRSTVRAIPSTPFDFSTIFAGGTTLAKRRRFLDRLTVLPSRTDREPIVEWQKQVPDATTEGTWTRVPWEYRVLVRECGILFTGDKPPAELVQAGAAARIRITATVRGDQRLKKVSNRRAQSPNGNTIVLSLDCHHSLHDRQILTTGTYKSAFDASSGVYPPDDVADDSAKAQALADNARNTEDAARIGVQIELTGIQLQFEIGQLVTAIEGRNLVLDEFSPQASSAKYPQITGIAYDRQRQITRLTVASFDKVVSNELHFGGHNRGI